MTHATEPSRHTRVLKRMTNTWQGRTALRSLAIGLALGTVLTLLALPALRYEIADHANLLTRVLAYGFLLVPVAVITVLKSDSPITHTTGLVAGATAVLATTAQTYTGTPMPYVWLAATTLFGCAAARIIRNERYALTAATSGSSAFNESINASRSAVGSGFAKPITR